MTFEVWSRSRVVVNTDPQRRCYNGCNFSERVDYGEWSKFGEYDTKETADRVVRGLRCERYEYKLKDTS